MQSNNHIIIIAGPTGIGKSALAERIAARIPADIINMDVGQFYTPFTIGTAKPLWQKSPIPHHFFDILDEPINMSVVEYRERLLALLPDIWARGRMPILVGGSAFYLKSLLFPITHQLTDIKDPGDDQAAENLWQKLAAIDPIRAAAIHQNDRYRLQRALAIAAATGQQPSSYDPAYNPPASYTLTWLTRERDDLYARINARVLSMMESGWLDEVRALKGTAWEMFLHAKKLIGYNELLAYCAHEEEQSLDVVIDTIQLQTRKYAKRQEVFWRMLHKELERQHKNVDSKHDFSADIQALNLTFLDLDLYIKQLLERLMHVK